MPFKGSHRRKGHSELLTHFGLEWINLVILHEFSECFVNIGLSFSIKISHCDGSPADTKGLSSVEA